MKSVLKGRAVAQDDNRWPLTAEALVLSWTIPFMLDKLVLDQSLLYAVLFFLSGLLHSHVRLNVTVTGGTDERGLRTFKASNLLPDIWKH